MRIIVLTDLSRSPIYLDASTDEQLYRNCLSILKARVASSEWQNIKQYQVKEPPKPSFEEGDIPKFPVELREAATMEYTKYKDAILHWKTRKTDWDAIDTALSHNDGRLACRILTQRKYWETEGFEVKEVYAIYPSSEEERE